MQSGSRHIIIAGACMGILSMLYFLALVCHIPFFLAVPLVVFGLVALVRWLQIPGQDAPKATRKFAVWFMIMLVAGIALLVQKSYPVNLRYGGWDAWAIWNLHAQYMAMGVHGWQTIFANTIGHPDYPLLLPGLEGFFMHLLPKPDLVVIPFITSITFTLLIPVLLYLVFAGRNMVIAAAALFLLAQDVFYLSNGISEYADIVVAFFFLCALICADNSKQGGKYVALSAFFIGCCAWTKNEGILLALVFLAFYLETFLCAANRKYFFVGIAMPVIVLLIHKAGFAPANDLMGQVSEKTSGHLWESSRYNLVWTSFAKNIDDNFAYLKPALIGYVLISLVQKRWPSKNFLLVVTVLVAYMFSYIALSKEQTLAWQLDTSQGRLLIQLMPAMLYVLADKFSDVQLSVAGKKGK